MDPERAIDRPSAAPPDDLSSGPFRTAEAEPMAIEDIRDALVVRENGVFLLTDKYGNVPEGNQSGFGLYRADMRYLSTYELACETAPLVMLLSSAAQGYAAEQVFTIPRLVAPDGREVPRETVEVRRHRLIDGDLRETVEITNFNVFPVTLDIGYRFGSDFADIFTVRGLQPSRHGHQEPPRVEPNRVRLCYAGLDRCVRSTELEFDEPPDRIDARSAWFRVRLGPRGRRQLGLTIQLGESDRDEAVEHAHRRTHEAKRVATEHRRWRDACTRVSTSNEIFNAVLEQSLGDIRTLWNRPQSHDGASGYLAAGSPWFDTLFGRDSLIASLQLLAFNPTLARDTLLTLAAQQGRESNEWRDEQPGKILHELRTGEMARIDEIPFGRYYGSIDSTVLFLVLAAEYWRWTADRRLLRRLEPNLLACLDWVRQCGDRDGDGYVEYQRLSDKGLLNQGWKDSGDAIVHADGRLATPPIALVEVQAYLFAGLTGLAEVEEALGHPTVAQECRRAARRLYARFNRDFWMAAEQFYALALDGSKLRVESVSSNPGHALFAGIVSARRGAAVAARLLRTDMFSGWGVRTLSAESPRFNPMGYHVGSIWPHDNSLLAAGLKRYGEETALDGLATAIYDAARRMEYYRLPELFCGSARSANAEPVPYPVACRPQAWAAGTMPFVLTSLLGLCPDAGRDELFIVRPQLPGWLQRVELRNLRVGSGSVDLLFELKGRRTHVTMEETRGRLRVAVVPRWPR